MKYFLGIDPGLSGALAFYDPIANELGVFDMPTHEIKTAGKKKRIIDMHSLAHLIDARRGDTRKALIEKVSAMPKQGVTSSFNFGFSAGCIQMAVVANMIPIELISPSTWKKNMGLSGDKMESRKMASQLMPKHAHHWPLAKHDGRAEAALLAYYSEQSHPMAPQRNKFEDML